MRAMLSQAKEPLSRPANHRERGERAGLGFSSQPSDTNPAALADFQPSEPRGNIFRLISHTVAVLCENSPQEPNGVPGVLLSALLIIMFIERNQGSLSIGGPVGGSIGHKNCPPWGTHMRKKGGG